MSMKVNVKGQVTLPKAVREAAGIRPGDRVTVRARPGGGAIVEKEAPAPAAAAAIKHRIDMALAELDRRGIRFDATSDEMMRLLRDED